MVREIIEHESEQQVLVDALTRKMRMEKVDAPVITLFCSSEPTHHPITKERGNLSPTTQYFIGVLDLMKPGNYFFLENKYAHFMRTALKAYQGDTKSFDMGGCHGHLFEVMRID